jgi:hypothetical protein
MTVIDRSPARRAAIGAVLCLAGAILFAGCGGAAATPTPAPMPPPTATPAPPPAPTAAPTAKPNAAPTATPAASTAANLGGFAFPAEQVLNYYESAGFTCKPATPSTQAAGYSVVRCLKADEATKLTTIIALVADENAVTGDAFAGVVGTDGKTSATPEQAINDLAFFLGAMLGETAGQEAGSWLTQHLGEDLSTTVGDILVATYPGDKDTGLGYYVEVANKAFMDAPAP